ncbi:MAG: glycoside hydrolase family 15 protein [Thermoplasmata archaeon]|nr:glycoside hydrolase family 15 protein [Thermoplasmata archaeon]
MSRPTPLAADVGPYPPLVDFGVIGNLHTAALVSRRGSIDWACFPRFDSPSVFARLLDEREGGFQELAPVEPAVATQAYLRSTNVLETRFRLAHGRAVRIVDFMPLAPRKEAEGLAMVVRVVHATGGPVRLGLRCHPKFNYGEQSARWRRVAGGHQARSDGSALTLLQPWPATPESGRLTAEGVVRPGAPIAVEIIWGTARPTDAAPASLLAETTRFWRRWSNSGRAPYREIGHDSAAHVLRSELALKLLSYEDTGAFVAAATTSLPEWPGGRRNWDYRYAWIRDAAFTAQALLILGHVAEAKAFLRWTVARLPVDAVRGTLQVVYGGHGETDLTERSLPHLAGYANSRPVRVGNAAAGQFQLDIFGELLDAASVLSRTDDGFVRGVWTELASVVDSVARYWRRPDHGIWEVRATPRHYTHSKTMAWVALDRGVAIARRLRIDDERVVGWAEAADRIRSMVLQRGYNPEQRSFVQTLDGSAVDAAELRLPMVGLLPFTDARVRSTIRRVRNDLSTGPYVFRYRVEDGIPGAEGAFLPCSFWLVECLARMGERAEAERRLEALLPVGGPLGLFSEACDPRNGRALGNYPQALTHIALLRAVWALGGRKGESALTASEGRSGDQT